MKRLLSISLIFAVMLSGCRWAGDAGDTAFSEFKASSLLQKYTRFKDMYASLEAKKATLSSLDTKIKSTEDQYKGIPRKDWVLEDIQSLNQWKTEKDGLKASYNNLAAQYNADMSKANVNFTNTGDLPQGASDPLPRNVAPYIEK